MKISTWTFLSRGCMAATTLLGAVSAQALTIIPNYDSGINGLGNSSDVKNTIQAAINVLQNTFTDNVTLNINFVENENYLGASSATFYLDDYTEIYSSLQADRKSALDNQAFASLPNQVNENVTNHNAVWITSANLKALNISGTGPFDGTIYLGTAKCFTQAQGVTSGLVDLQAVTLHEIDEIMGIGGSGARVGGGVSTAGNLQAQVGMTDLFRYKSAGVHSFTTDPNTAAYLSADGGVTDFYDFNQSGTGDYGDWKKGPTPHVQDWQSTRGVLVPYSSLESGALDMIGWDVKTVPEPTSAFVIGVGLLALARRKSANPENL